MELRQNLWVACNHLTAWTGWAHCRARTNIVPKPRVSVPDAGLADTYLASPAQPRIRIGLGTTVARVLPAERPETCSRPSGVGRLRSAFGHVRRSRRAADAEGAPAAGRRNRHPARRHTSAFLAFDASPPAPVTHPLRRRTPVRTLASPIVAVPSRNTAHHSSLRLALYGRSHELSRVLCARLFPKATGRDLRMQRKPQPKSYPLSQACRMTHTLRLGDYLDRNNSNKTPTVFVK